MKDNSYDLVSQVLKVCIIFLIKRYSWVFTTLGATELSKIDSIFVGLY